jgi:3-phosphoshikimate 1-carboxyvinyltransferase
MRAIVEPVSYLEGTVLAPPSKNYSSRYIWIASLTKGRSEVVRPASNDDAKALIAACRQLGATIQEDGERLIIDGFGNTPNPVKTLNPGNGGLVLRLLLALGLWLPDVTYQTDYVDSLGKRPQNDLLTALTSLGVQVQSEDGHLPIHLQGHRGQGGLTVRVSGAVSSQYATALLLVAPLFPKGLTVQVIGGLRSRPPLETTLEVMAEAGVLVTADWERLIFTVPPGQCYQPRVYQVPGDYPAASALLAAASILPSHVRVERLFQDAQGERAVLDGLIQMGVDLRYDGNAVEVFGGNRLKGIDFNGDQAIDGVLAMAAVAAFAEGKTRFYGVGNLRFKESDRIGDFGAEFRKIGVHVGEGDEELIIAGNPQGYPGGVTIDAHHDHRIIMATAVMGLRTECPLSIIGAEHVRKSFPDFFETLKAIGAKVELADLA